MISRRGDRDCDSALPSGIPVASAETRSGDVQMKYAECHSVADIVREVFVLVRGDRSRAHGGRVAYYFRGENAEHFSVLTRKALTRN